MEPGAASGLQCQVTHILLFLRVLRGGVEAGKAWGVQGEGLPVMQGQVAWGQGLLARPRHTNAGRKAMPHDLRGCGPLGAWACRAVRLRGPGGTRALSSSACCPLRPAVGTGGTGQGGTAPGTCCAEDCVGTSSPRLMRGGSHTGGQLRPHRADRPVVLRRPLHQLVACTGNLERALAKGMAMV